MIWIYYLLLIATAFVGWILTAWMLPGLWLIVAAAGGYAYLTGGAFLGWHTLVALLLLSLGAEIGEFVLGGTGAKKAGASGWGILGGLLGAIVGGILLSGAVPVPVLGTVIGICIGTFFGAFGVEFLLGKGVGDSLRIGLGATRGRLTGMAAKITVGAIMIVLTIWMALPTGRHNQTAAPSAKTAPVPTTMPGSQ